MLKKAHRLNSNEVGAVTKKGRRMSTGLFSLHILPSEKGKIAVIIPKKVAKTSVLRHNHKRRIMAAIVKYTKTSPLPHTYIVFTLRQHLTDVAFAELYAHIEEIFVKIGS